MQMHIIYVCDYMEIEAKKYLLFLFISRKHKKRFIFNFICCNIYVPYIFEISAVKKR